MCDAACLFQIVLETDRQTLSFSALHVEDLESMVGHMTASLKRIFPDSSPGKLLKTIAPDLQQRLLTQTAVVEEQINSQPGYCGGFSDTYAALCDFNEMPFREEIQWDIDNIYYINNWRQFNLQDFSHLDSRDLALAVAALSFNQWFTKIYCKELKLSVDVQQQLTFLLSRSPSLEELSLEASGLKLDFAVKMAAALREHTSSALQYINLSGNPIEDKGGKSYDFTSSLVHSLIYPFAGLGCLSQVLSSTQLFSATLTHLDLSSNPGSLITEEATFLFKFLSSTNSLSHLDLSDTTCPLDTVSERQKVREVTRSIREFFSQSCELKYVGLSATKLPPQALRLLLQGLATNTRLFGLELDLSSCELRSAGAQVIQEHISEATAIKSLDISDNGFENNMVTLVLSVGRCHSLRHLALGRNFAMKSRALTDVLHRIAQLIQDEECPLHSLSVCDSKLKTGMHILLSALGGHAALAEVDISGNNIGDTGAKMLAKALMSNTRLRSLTWDRNNVTARGFQDVADALERNFTLQQVSVPLADITQSYRSNPDRTREALHKVICDQSNGTAMTVSMVQGVCRQLEDSLKRLNHCNVQEVQADIQAAHEVLHNARESFKVQAAHRVWKTTVLRHYDDKIITTLIVTEELAQGLMGYAEAACPQVVQRSSVCECLSECVSKRSRQTHSFLRSTLVENTGQIINNRLRELRQTLSVSLAESIIDQVLQDLTMAQNKMVSVSVLIPELRLADSDFPTDDYSPAFWRNSFHCKSLRPAPSIKSLLDADWEQQTRDRGAERERGGEDGGGRCGLPQLPTATPLSVTGARGASFIPPPSLPLRQSISARAPEEEAASRPLPSSGSPASPMEPLPTQGQTLRHYTASRPRPRRTHTQPPSSRPQEPVSKVENEAIEVMGRVDEGVEEFFTKKIIPDYALKGRWEESNSAQATPSESSSTPSASTPFSSSSDNITSSTTTTVTSPSVPSTDTSFTSTDVPPISTSSIPPASFSVTTITTPTTTTLPTKNIKKKFGDFFAFKRARASRAAKAGGGDGGGEGVKVKRTSIADLIRPLREAKEREREREREKGRGARSVEDANVCNDAATTEGTVATSHHLAGDVRGTMVPAKTLTTMTPPSDTAPSYPTIATSPDLTTATISNLEEEAAPGLPGRTPSPVVTSPLTEQERSGVLMKEMKLGGTPYGERRLKVTKRSLREGKSQSLILLTGLEPEDKDDTHSKKHASENTSSFEQRLQVMLHRMGVAKTPPADTKTSQNKDEELRKANSEGAILDKPEPPPTYMKPRTMSTSSDPRHPMRALDPIRPDPPLHPKPALPERPIGPLPPKPAIAAKPPFPTPAAPADGGISVERVQLRAHTHDGRPGETTAQSLPKPRQHLKPLPQRRAVSVHEDTLAMTQELKAVLQRSPIRFRGNRGDLPTCTEIPSSGEEAQRAQEGESGVSVMLITYLLFLVFFDLLFFFLRSKRILQSVCMFFIHPASDKGTAGEKKEAVQKDELKAERGRTGCEGTVAETKHSPPGEEEAPGSGCPSSTAQAQQEASAPRLLGPAAALDKERPLALIQILEKPPVPPTSQKKSPSRVPALPQTLEKLLVSPPTEEKTPSTIPAESPENPQVSPLSHKEKGPGTNLASVDLRNSTQERGEAVSKQHTTKAEPADQRTEPPLSK
uniref:Capping protein regulator and myosin 1 linker 2 n=1 Tax=Dicentrarchus labrax TaxID=13489 RepID=A0A8C4ELX5_DICLA